MSNGVPETRQTAGPYGLKVGLNRNKGKLRDHMEGEGGPVYR